MSILCTICQDGIMERPQILKENDGAVVVCTLLCGHLFHKACLQQWFATGSGLPRSAINNAEFRCGICPSCRKYGFLRDTIQLFPHTDEDYGDMDELDELKSKVDTLTTENEDLKRKLMNSETNYEKLENEHEVLRLQHGQTLSLVEELREEVNDFAAFKNTLEESVKTAVEKSEMNVNKALSEKNDLKDAILKLLAKLSLYNNLSLDVDVHGIKKLIESS